METSEVSSILPGPLTTIPGKTVGSWLDEYAAEIRSRAYHPHTVGNKLTTISHVRELWGDHMLKTLRPKDIQEKLVHLTAGHSSMAQRVLSELRSALSSAVVNGQVDSNPAIHVKMPRHQVLRARLSLEQWSAGAEKARSHRQRWVYPLFVLALVTAQRRADLAKMRFSDIVDGSLRVEQQKKAGKPLGARVAIPLNLRLNSIGMSVGDAVELCGFCGRPGSTLLRRAGGGDIEESSLSARVHECFVSALGEEAFHKYEWPSLHEFRSLGARLYRSQGVDVQTLLGHKNSEMTSLYLNDRGLSAQEWRVVH